MKLKIYSILYRFRLLYNMKTLYESILENNKIDGHVHMFDHSGIIDKHLIDISKRCVCFADISFKYIDKYYGDSMIKLYDNFITNQYDANKHILLATGENAEDIINIYKKHQNVIRGFGELKCYSEYIHGKLPYGNLDWIKPVLDYNASIGLPVYIHYNLENDDHIYKFKELLMQYRFPIVLCHCGMYENCNYEMIHDTVLDLTKQFDNAYVDISYSAVNYYLQNSNKLLQFDNKKVIIGTDMNPVIGRQTDDPIECSKHIYDNFYRLHRLGNFDIAIKRIFNK